MSSTQCVSYVSKCSFDNKTSVIYTCVTYTIYTSVIYTLKGPSFTNLFMLLLFPWGLWCLCDFVSDVLTNETCCICSLIDRNHFVHSRLKESAVFAAEFIFSPYGPENEQDILKGFSMLTCYIKPFIFLRSYLLFGSIHLRVFLCKCIFINIYKM